MAASNNTPPLIYLDKKWDPPKPVKAGVETFVICPTITRFGRDEIRSAVHSKDGAYQNQNLFTMHYTFDEEYKMKVFLGGRNIPKSWGNGDAFTNVQEFNSIDQIENSMENFLATFRNFRRDVHVIVPGTTLKIAFGRHAGLKLYEEGLITFDMIRSISSDHDTIIPYDAENKLIGQFMDLTWLPNDNNDAIGRLEEDGKWEGSFLEKMHASRSFLCKLKIELNEVTDLAKKEAASNNPAPDTVASLSPSNNSNGSAKRKR